MKVGIDESKALPKYKLDSWELSPPTDWTTDQLSGVIGRGVIGLFIPQGVIGLEPVLPVCFTFRREKMTCGRWCSLRSPTWFRSGSRSSYKSFNRSWKNVLVEISSRLGLLWLSTFRTFYCFFQPGFVVRKQFLCLVLSSHTQDYLVRWDLAFISCRNFPG